MDGKKIEEFELGEPVLVCRWRLTGGRLPLENRHLRALSRRVVAGCAVSPQLVSWAKQHIEWTLREGSAACPDGVLMLVMDACGRAAMSVGPYAELADAGLEALVARAAASEREADETGVAPETLWLVRDGALACCAEKPVACSGAATLVADLAKARGLAASYGAAVGDGSFDEAFLCSDEHGIVPAAGAAGEVSALLAADYAKLLEAERAKRR